MDKVNIDVIEFTIHNLIEQANRLDLIINKYKNDISLTSKNIVSVARKQQRTYREEAKLLENMLESKRNV